MSTGLWSWALDAYGRPGVEPLLLRLQDERGQCAPLLLWAAWSQVEGRPPEGPVLVAACALARDWEANVTGPLRHSRRWLKAAPVRTGVGNGETLRQSIKAAELQAERLLLDRLEALSLASGARADERAEAPELRTVVTAYGACAPDRLVDELAAALCANPVELRAEVL